MVGRLGNRAMHVSSQPDDVSGHQRNDCGGPRALRRWQSVPRHGFGTKRPLTLPSGDGRSRPAIPSRDMWQYAACVLAGLRDDSVCWPFEAPVTVGRTMGYRAVALSQVDGSGAESIGRDVAQRLGFGYLDDAIVAQVASERGGGVRNPV